MSSVSFLPLMVRRGDLTHVIWTALSEVLVVKLFRTKAPHPLCRRQRL